VRAVGVLANLLLQVPVAIVTTLVGARLLGMRRSWVGKALAGAIGWTAANLLVVGLTHWNWDAAELSTATICFSIVLTMIAALALDFAARPGTLARGEWAGLFMVPRPVRDLRRRLAPYARYRELIDIAHRNGLATAAGFTARRRPSEERVPVGLALRRTLEQCGTMFVKLGQMASTRADIVPAEVRAELSLLQSHVDPAPRDAMQAELETELSGGVDEFFSEFDWEPIGTASIAQAYRARLKTGEAVVVKIQRPGMDELVARDTAALLHLARAIELRTPQGREMQVTELALEFVRTLERELDFLVEAAKMTELAQATDADSGVRVPAVHRGLLTRRVIVQEYFEGRAIARERISALGLDGRELADRLVRVMIAHILQGEFHADLHPGNVLLGDDGTICVIDFGSTGHLDPVQRMAIFQMMAAATAGDAAGLRDAIERVATVGDDIVDAVLEQALARFLTKHVVSGKDLDASALNDLIPLLTTFDIRMPSELTMFFRAIVQLDGTVRSIEPGYSLIDAMGRVMDRELPGMAILGGSVRDQLTKGLLTELPRLQRLPAQVERIVSLAARGELRGRIALFSNERDARVVTTLVNRLVLGMVGGLVMVGSTVLLDTSGGAVAAGNTSYVHVFGFVGLGVATILLLRVVAGIVRDGYN